MTAKVSCRCTKCGKKVKVIIQLKRVHFQRSLRT